MGSLMTLMTLMTVVMQLMSWSLVAGVTNMLGNPGFEESDMRMWKRKAMDGLVRTSEDKQEGSYSLRTVGRRSHIAGPKQKLKGVQMGRAYQLTAYAKLLSDKPGKLWQRMRAIVLFNLKFAENRMRDPQKRRGNYLIAYRAFVKKGNWILLTGNINAPMIPFTSVKLFFHGPDPEIDFLLDNVTFYEIPENTNWLSESHVMVDKNRKSNFSLRVHMPENVQPDNVDIQVRLKKHLFPFGCKFEEKISRKNSLAEYKKLFFNLFNWATVPDLSWKQDKGPTLYEPDYTNAMKAVDELNENGIKVRGSSLVRGVERNIPYEVVVTPPEDLTDLIQFRVQYMMNLTKGKIEVWDVMNEYLHGRWFDETLQNATITEAMLKWAKEVNPEVKLSMNEFICINSGASTEEYRDLAMRLIEAGTGIRALGIQGHAKAYTKPDPTMIWKRLDDLAETGLELYLTEHDIGWYDDITRADWFEDSMRAYFAHPAMTGVTLWGIWKEMQRYPNQYLIYGPDMKFAEQGERFVCLTQKEWTTDQTFNMAGASSPAVFPVRGFHGDYEVIVRKNKVAVQKETFSTPRTDPVDIHVTESSTAIAEDTKHDYVPKCISHRDRKSVGKMTSTSTSSDITCSSHEGETSGSFACPEGTVMTSCSSFQNANGSLQWTGEAIAVTNDVATCVPPDGAKVFVRCCSGADLTCDYRQAGPSSLFDGAMAEATCPVNHTAVGCTACSQNSRLKGAFTNPDMTSCLAQNGASVSSDPSLLSGVVSGAACCSRPAGFQCRQEKGTAPVTCPDGDVMTGCNVEAENGSAAGARIYDGPDDTTYCQIEAEGDSEVQAVATCCTP